MAGYQRTLRERNDVPDYSYINTIPKIPKKSIGRWAFENFSPFVLLLIQVPSSKQSGFSFKVLKEGMSEYMSQALGLLSPSWFLLAPSFLVLCMTNQRSVSFWDGKNERGLGWAYIRAGLAAMLHLLPLILYSISNTKSTIQIPAAAACFIEGGSRQISTYSNLTQSQSNRKY